MQNIEYQIRNISPDLFVRVKADIAQLPDILMESEKILYVVDGLYDGVEALLLSTDTRMIIKELGHDVLEVIPNERIALMQYFESIIDIHTNEDILTFKSADSRLALEFCKSANAILENQEAPTPEESDESVYDLLEQLGKLKDNGILTHEEFTEQKKKLLEKL